jgi:hypothetical protein
MLKGVLLDLGGVVYVGDEPLPGAVESIDRLKSEGLVVRFITNVTRQSRRRLLEKLARLGLQASANEVFMPAIAARIYLANQGHSPHLLVSPALEECPQNRMFMYEKNDLEQSISHAYIHPSRWRNIQPAPASVITAVEAIGHRRSYTKCAGSPSRKVPRTIIRKFRTGFTSVKSWINGGMLAIGGVLIVTRRVADHLANAAEADIIFGRYPLPDVPGYCTSVANAPHWAPALGAVAGFCLALIAKMLLP